MKIDETIDRHLNESKYLVSESINPAELERLCDELQYNVELKYSRKSSYGEKLQASGVWFVYAQSWGDLKERKDIGWLSAPTADKAVSIIIKELKKVKDRL